MCGIAGFSGALSGSQLDAMSDAIAHRGPDDAGVFLNHEAGVGLAHRRLSIIDLSASGHQPMWDATGTAVIVFNGEIYNYRELRRGLEADGFRFQGTSDTEVLVNLYLRHGAKMLEALNGIFAFAIWDAGARTLFVARDQLGIKPLYFAQTRHTVLFASELKALLVCEELDRSPCPEAIQDYLTYLWCPAP